MILLIYRFFLIQTLSTTRCKRLYLDMYTTNLIYRLTYTERYINIDTTHPPTKQPTIYNFVYIDWKNDGF